MIESTCMLNQHSAVILTFSLPLINKDYIIISQVYYSIYEGTSEVQPLTQGLLGLNKNGFI